MSLERLQSALSNQSATSFADARLLALNDRLDDVWATLTNLQVGRLFHCAVSRLFYATDTDRLRPLQLKERS